MMKRSKRATPVVSTASLPDIIFILLFFFMVTTVLRTKNLMVKQRLPEGTAVQKLEKKSLVSFIYIGPPKDSVTYGNAPRIQLNDKFAKVSDIADYVESQRQQVLEVRRKYMTFSLKVDKNTKMGIVTDVKQALRKVNALKINYSTIKVNRDLLFNQ